MGSVKSIEAGEKGAGGCPVGHTALSNRRLCNILICAGLPCFWHDVLL